MRRENYIFAALAAIVAVGMIFFFSSNKKENKSVETKSTKRSERLVASSRQEQTERKSLAVITAQDLKSLRNNYPDKENVKEEVERNPHNPPKSVVNFAMKMGPLMERAYRNDDDAEKLINALHDCALDNSVATTARAMCVSNAEKISKKHPKLKEISEEMRAGVSGDVKTLLQRKDRLLRQ